jgi:hypothetical protein
MQAARVTGQIAHCEKLTKWDEARDIKSIQFINFEIQRRRRSLTVQSQQLVLASQSSRTPSASMSWALSARRASLSEALHTLARLLPAKANNISSNSNDDDFIIVTSNLKQQTGIILRNINELAETLAS